MICTKCNRELSEEGKCVGCGLPQEECTCPAVEKTSEAEASDENPSSEEPTEEKTA